MTETNQSQETVRRASDGLEALLAAAVADVADGGKRKWRKLNYGALSQLTDAG